MCCQLSAPNLNSNQAEEKAEFFRLKCSEDLRLGPHFNRCNLHLQPAAVSLSASRRYVQQEAQRRREGAVRKSSPLLTGPRLSMQFAAHRHMSITAVVGQHTTGPPAQASLTFTRVSFSSLERAGHHFPGSGDGSNKPNMRQP